MQLAECARFKGATPRTDMMVPLVCYRTDGEREVVQTVIKSRGALHGMALGLEVRHSSLSLSCLA
jgi:hypothetical protein